MTGVPTSDAEWIDLLNRLTLYADNKLIPLYWRGVPAWKGGRPPKGIEATDLAAEAIEFFLSGQRNWNREKCPDFEQYLRGTVSSRISHLVNSLENKKTRPAPQPMSSDDEPTTSFEDTVPGTDPGPADVAARDELRDRARRLMEEALDGDPDALAILECLDAGIIKPADIAELTERPVADIYNAQKRFKRARARVRKGIGKGSTR